MDLTQFVGKPAVQMLNIEPFKQWHSERSVEEDLDERVVQYVFDGHGFELRCDSHERITSIFLHAEEYGGFDAASSGFEFSQNRESARRQYGVPQAQSDGLSDPVLGEFGPWDRFDWNNCVLHLEYTLDGSSIRKVTLMAADVAP